MLAAASIIALVFLIVVVFYVLCIIGNWKVFTKAGESGWKSIIPFYNSYILYKISWSTKWFWYSFLLGIVGSICSSMAPAMGGFFNVIGGLISLAVLLLTWVQLHKLSKAFGHDIGFTVGLIILNPIFTLILGLGKSEYIGQQ